MLIKSELLPGSLRWSSDHLVVILALLGPNIKYVPYLSIIIFGLNAACYVPNEIPRNLLFIGQIKVTGKTKFGLELLDFSLIILISLSLPYYMTTVLFLFCLVVLKINESRYKWLLGIEPDKPDHIERWIEFKEKYYVYSGLRWYFVILLYIMLYFTIIIFKLFW
jgi:hypothetical protein